jgi:hypothetical protein
MTLGVVSIHSYVDMSGFCASQYETLAYHRIEAAGDCCGQYALLIKTRNEKMLLLLPLIQSAKELTQRTACYI